MFRALFVAFKKILNLLFAFLWPNRRYIWQNGKIKKWSYGTTHVMNPSLHYGIAAFEGIRFYQTDRGPAVFRLKDHLDRFFYSMNV
ncbi:MAG: branched-chain amino acid aminotransferase, partial [Parcubacteria group bacterium Gr01-1014_66]